METRLRLCNKKRGYMIQVAMTKIEILKNIRQKYPQYFKNARIQKIIQAFPDEIKLEKLYEIGEFGNKWILSSCSFDLSY